MITLSYVLMELAVAISLVFCRMATLFLVEAAKRSLSLLPL
ncbi:hypothetical protein [Nostoc sp.]